MKLCILCIGFVLLFAGPVRAQQATIYDEPLSERRVSYDIDVTLLPDSRDIQGKQRLTWRNPDNVPVSELQFHLYMNAFKNPNSTFMRESGGESRGFTASGEDRWGGINVTRMRLLSSAQPDVAPLATATPPEVDLTDRIRFIQPDDGNTDDQTVISVQLPRAVQPGETIALDIDFETTFPKIIARTGWVEKDNGKMFFFGGQWFPKIGVYEIPGQRYVPEDAPHGQWNTHQFHANSEFYADYGTYDVSLTVPDDYLIGASGVLVAEEDGDGTRTVTYHADDVHDFAWTASNDFLEYTDTWRHVSIKLMLQPEHEAQAQRHFDAAKVALDYFDRWVGEYPYRTLTLVDGKGGSNGMEYPTLITCGTVYKLPPWARLLEMVTIHEFGHQYFYGLIGTNEFEEAWLDEGITSYIESRIIDDVYGKGSFLDFPGLRIIDGAFQRVSYTKNRPTRGATYTFAWEYTFSGDYGKASYAKPATFLTTLENYLGWETMEQIIKTYYTRWRFDHPTTNDFIAIAEEISGRDLDWFFDQFVFGTVAVDYAVEYVLNEPVETVEDADEQTYEAWVLVHRKQDGIYPQKLRVLMEDGRTEEVEWDGTDVWKKFTFEGRGVEAYLDPDNEVWVDINRLNNRKLAEPENTLARKAQLKVAVWLQQFFYLMSGLF